MITLDERIHDLILCMGRMQVTMDLIRLEAPPVAVANSLRLISKSAGKLKDSLNVGDATNAIKIAYEMYLDQEEDEPDE